jgi:hypothetical protein
MPVGKAIALAAMPSAALLGMGFTSPLAKADQQPQNPFQPGACVELPEEPADGAPDEPSDAATEDAATEDAATEGAAAADATMEDAATDGAAPRDPLADPESGEPELPEEPAADAREPERPEEPGDAADPGAGEAPAATMGEDGPAGAEQSEGSEGSEEPEEPEEEDQYDPLDPLGLGEELAGLGEGLAEGLEGLFLPGRQGDEDEPPVDGTGEPIGPEPGQRERDTAEELPAEAESEEPTEPEGPDESAGSDEPAADRDEDREQDQGQDENRQQEQEQEQQEDQQEDQDTEPEDDAAGDPFAPDENGLVPFPCPTELHVPGTDEQTPLTLADEPWYLEATYLTLRGLRYHGVVNITTANGTVKQVLKFTAEKVDIGDLHQIVDGPGGVRHHVATDPGSTSTFRGGTVTMYTERLEGNLFGVLPVVYDPEHQPPVDLPAATFTEVLVTQAGQFGGDLSMRGMDIYTTDDGPTVRVSG